MKRPKVLEPRWEGTVRRGGTRRVFRPPDGKTEARKGKWWTQADSKQGASAERTPILDLGLCLPLLQGPTHIDSWQVMGRA